MVIYGNSNFIKKGIYIVIYSKHINYNFFAKLFKI